MFVAAQSFAVGTDTPDTARAAALNAQESFATESRDAVAVHIALVFMDVSFDHKTALKTIQRVLGRHVLLLGCTTAGEIGPNGPIRQQSITIMLLGGDDITAYASVEKHLERDAGHAGARLGKTLRKKLRPDPTLVLTFADGITNNGAELIDGLTSSLGDQTTVVGGNAGDGETYKKTYQFLGTNVYTDSVVAVGIAGTLPFSVAVNHGWLPVGIPKTITRVEGTTVKDIDGRPAIELYEEYLGKHQISNLRKHMMSDIALSYPLGIQILNAQSGQAEYSLPRVPLRVDKEGGIVFSDSIPEKTMVRLMVGNAPDAIEAARTAATMAQEKLGPLPPQAALVFSSHVRRSLFSSLEEATSEVREISKVVGSQVPLCGFYTYGEYAPLQPASSTTSASRHVLHNDSIVVLLLGHE